MGKCHWIQSFFSLNKKEKKKETLSQTGISLKSWLSNVMCGVQKKKRLQEITLGGEKTSVYEEILEISFGLYAKQLYMRMCANRHKQTHI